MRKELANSGLSEEEILAKTMLLQKALAGDNSPAFVNKTIKSALQAANISAEDLAKVINIYISLSGRPNLPNTEPSVMFTEPNLTYYEK